MSEIVDLHIRIKKLLVERIYESFFLIFVVGSVLGYAVGARIDKCDLPDENAIEVVDEEKPEADVSVTMEVPVPIVNDPDRSSGLVNDIQLESVCADIAGAIAKPGVYCLDQGSMVIDIVKEAGGFSSSVADSYVARIMNLSQQVRANSKIYIPYEEEVKCDLLELTLKNVRTDEVLPNVGSTGETTEPLPEQTDEQNQNSDVSAPSCIDLNSASISELIEIDGIGESTAQKIIDARPFVSVEGLLDVSGIGDAKYAQMKDSFCPI